ncbi:MAG TPA: SPFH domain-containing protein [Fervidobacterium sp.]|nr:SPFH domain-containing protein [Fervidobacterium sp.]HOM74547.1 SPFH domain-containing protein [Fervidobacterium sp.]
MALIDVIKYDGPEPDSKGQPTPWLVYKFPSESLKLGSQLIVRPGQEAIFLKEGIALDVFGPGRHTLSTANLPILEKLVNLPFGGTTPFTAEVYFVNKTARLDIKWGTPDPIQVEDPKYGVIVRVRGFGRFGIRISNSRNFVTQIVGALNQAQIMDYEEVINYFKGLVIESFKTIVANLIVNKRVSVLDIATLLNSISVSCQEKITSEFDRFGIETLNFFIESVNIPEEDMTKLKEILQEKAQFEILGDERYTKKRAFDVLDKAASNEGAGGTAGTGLGLGLGMSLGIGVFKALNTNDIAKQITIIPSEHKIKCPKCGTENSSTANFCSNCGEKLQNKSIICPNCKTENSPGARFCSNCGTKLG